MTMGLSNTQPHSHSRSHGIIGDRSHSHSHGHGSHDHEKLIETLQSEGEYLTCLGHIFVYHNAHTCHILRYSLPFLLPSIVSYHNVKVAEEVALQVLDWVRMFA